MIKLKIGNNSVLTNGVYKSMDVAPFIKNQRTFLPVRFVSEALGYNVEWDDSKKEVTIYGRKKYFETMDDCAYDWGMYFNAPSIALFKEFGGIIYKDENGYYWDNVKMGNDKAVIFDPSKVKKGVAFIHAHSGGTHATTKTFSQDDKYEAKRCDRPLYMTDSGGELHIYDPAYDEKGKRIGSKTLRNGLPVDVKYLDMTESAENMRQYFNNNYHGLPECALGYLADFYNRMYMMNKKYTDVQECKNL